MTTPAPGSGSRAVRPTVLYSLAATLVLAVVLLAVIPATVHVRPTGAASSSSTCASIVGAGWPFGNAPRPATGVTEYNGLDDAQAVCAARRDGRLALMVLLGVAASVAVTFGARSSGQASMRSGSSS